MILNVQKSKLSQANSQAKKQENGLFCTEWLKSTIVRRKEVWSLEHQYDYEEEYGAVFEANNKAAAMQIFVNSAGLDSNTECGNDRSPGS